MHSKIFVANSDALNRYRMMFTVGALEHAIFDNALTGIPSLLSHDIHRPIGWNIPFGLYFEPNLTRLVGEYLLPENENDQRIIYRAHHRAFAKRYHEHCDPYLEEFQKIMGSHLTPDAEYFFNGCVAYRDSNILSRIYPELKSLQDKDGLVFISDLFKTFEYLGQGIFRDKKRPLAIFCHQYFRRNLSHRNNFHYYFLDEFITETSSNIRLRIALDFNLIGYAPSFTNQMELEYWWGPKYSDDVAGIPVGVTQYQCDERQKLFSCISATQFWWKNSENEKILEVEELRDVPALGVGKDDYGCRYIHSIFKDGAFSHFDGAVRMYSSDKMIERLDKPINKAGKNSTYTKLFRIDGQLELSKWKTFVTNYFQDNPLIYEYFGLKAEHKQLLAEIDPQKEKSVQNKLVPYLMRDENGLRLFVSYHEPSTTDDNFERMFINLDSVLRENGDRNPSLEFNALEIVKTIKRLGHELMIPKDTLFVKASDDFINYPTILHPCKDSSEALKTTLGGYLMLFKALASKAVRVVSFTLAWQMEGREVRLSVCGTLTEVIKWLNCNTTIPVDRSGFRNWLEGQKKWLAANYQAQNNYPDLYDMVKRDGVMYMQRSMIDHDWIEYEETDIGLQYTLTIPNGNDELQSAFSKNLVVPSISFIVEKATCSKTGDDYFTSLTSKALDDDVAAVIERASGLTAVWTTSLA